MESQFSHTPSDEESVCHLQATQLKGHLPTATARAWRGSCRGEPPQRSGLLQAPAHQALRRRHAVQGCLGNRLSLPLLSRPSSRTSSCPFWPDPLFGPLSYIFIPPESSQFPQRAAWGSFQASPNDPQSCHWSVHARCSRLPPVQHRLPRAPLYKSIF